MGSQVHKEGDQKDKAGLLKSQALVSQSITVDDLVNIVIVIEGKCLVISIRLEYHCCGHRTNGSSGKHPRTLSTPRTIELYFWHRPCELLSVLTYCAGDSKEPPSTIKIKSFVHL